MKWITREKVKVDRVACPWLIKNFIDPQAEFVFLPRETDWSKVRDGVVYDVPDCELGHHGEDVSFDSILKKYQLTDPALLLLADIVRAADSHPSNPHPAGRGCGGLRADLACWACRITRFSSASLSSTTRCMQSASGA